MMPVLVFLVLPASEARLCCGVGLFIGDIPQDEPLGSTPSTKKKEKIMPRVQVDKRWVAMTSGEFCATSESQDFRVDPSLGISFSS